MVVLWTKEAGEGREAKVVSNRVDEAEEVDGEARIQTTIITITTSPTSTTSRDQWGEAVEEANKVLATKAEAKTFGRNNLTSLLARKTSLNSFADSFS